MVGASCPAEKIEWLLSLLRPEGGVIVTPVSPSDLRKVTKLPDGHSSHRVISQVRFSNLEASCCTPPRSAGCRTVRFQSHVEELSAGRTPSPELSVACSLIPVALNAPFLTCGSPQSHKSSYSQIQWISAKWPVARFMHAQALTIM